MNLVYESIRKNRATYLCEICSFGYTDIGMAEACEHFCNSRGFSSPDIHKKAVHRPVEPVLSLAA